MFSYFTAIGSGYNAGVKWYADEMKTYFGFVSPHPKEEVFDGEGRLIDMEAYKPKKTDTQCLNCPRIYYPVCGHDKITYANMCILNCLNKTTFYRDGQCINYRRNLLPAVLKPRSLLVFIIVKKA